ncbi:hydroxymethylglutaryl-CoA lyase [Roseomonas hellenica]|uniref:Hydroxymethylglutaryl-CoA lyase n=1 Tax=Plastoroseomonas hellenica TaxID=2687306 RepID=A0ABS5F5S0_9PROT|nr:hydroxymethylglutaryl-CoA lyase [Plastoroseomonas hellenica]MBR0667915.1 hydroxymethylglutaryl-CoA lyase [Plastoroseomonas hellenica]
MSDYPASIDIMEEGPREGFQIEPGPIPTADKIALIDALSATGVQRIQVASFVNPKLVPGWADAEAVVAGFTPRAGVTYGALWFNPRGLERTLAFKDRLSVAGSITVSASEAFSKQNLNRDRPAQLDAMRSHVTEHLARGVAVNRVSVQAAFGCNFSGTVTTEQTVAAVVDAMALAAETGCAITRISIADSMGWANPAQVERVVGAVRSRWPEPAITLHLHDTRGLGIACALAGLRMGVRNFDAAVGGLGGCPFARHPGAPGNIATEELVFLCEEMGIATGIDLEALLEASALAERIVGHRLPSAMLRGGGLAAHRVKAA